MKTLHFKKKRWSPYIVGSLIGILLSFLLTLGYTIGVSTGIARSAALIQYFLSKDSISHNSYFFTLLNDQPLFDWKILFIIGIFFGALLTSKYSDEKPHCTQTLWVKRFGTSKIGRYLTAFVGGIFLSVGARIANGCTSGHAISGGGQLSLTSWIFIISLFSVAIPTSMLIYSKNRRL